VLTKRGSEGWELVAVIQPKDDVFPTFYFKRPRANSATAGGAE
jgi:hypothetical protein